MIDVKKTTLITGLDIGSSKVSAVAAEIMPAGAFRVIAQSSFPSRGIVRGDIMELGQAVDSVSRALSGISQKTGKKAANIYVNISGQAVKGIRSGGMIPISLRGREVTVSDMKRCADVAGTIHLPLNREIIHRVVRGFSVDEGPSVINPLGLYASRLNCEVYIITADVNHIQNIYKCVNDAGYDIKEIVYSGMADGAGLLDNEGREEDTLILDMGMSLTEASFFTGGLLAAMTVLAAGAGDIKSDFKSDAEFDRLITGIKLAIEDYGKAGGKVNSVIVTGGLAFTDGIAEFLEEKLARPVRMGVVKDIRGDISSLDSVRLSTALGLAKYALRYYTKKAIEEKSMVRRLSTKVVDIFNNYF